jgi:phage terminase large subunit GpA-like protein
VYYFQNDAAVGDFSNDRAQPMIEQSPYLSKRVRSTNNVGLKQVGPSSLYFRGLFTKGKVKSVDADAIFLDELDEAKPSNVVMAIDRLMHSDLQWVTFLSQPSYPGVGVDAEFVDTDQQFWHVKCPGCGHWNCLDLNFPKNFIPITDDNRKSWPEKTTHYRGCTQCSHKLNMAEGKWVAKYPERKKRGYHLSQLFSQIKPPDYPNISSKIMYEYNKQRNTQW